jgi:CDP-diacylglycerol--glycerol-3-phosphate 3-phosphatidyltransferase
VGKAVENQEKTLTDIIRTLFHNQVCAVAGFLNRLGISPNVVTFMGLVGHFAAAYLLAIGQITWGGLVVLLTAPFDFLDGSMARLLGQTHPFGAFFDSVTDRYSELVLFGGLLIYFFREDNILAVGLVYVAIVGSIMVSYVRARGESLGFEAKIGLFSRMERYFVLVPSLIFNIPLVALWILAIFSNFTALQRIIHISHQAAVREGRG